MNFKYTFLVILWQNYKFSLVFLSIRFHLRLFYILFISFETEGIRNICENSEVAIQNLGELSANKLKTRLSELVAAKNLKEEVINLYIKLDDERKLYILPIGSHYLELKPVNNPLQKDNKGSFKLDRITRLKVLSIKKIDS